MAIADYPSITNTPLDIVELRHRRRESALTQLVAHVERLGITREADVLLAGLLRLERHAPSGLGKGVAVPHARSLAVLRPFVMVGRSNRGLEWGAADGADVRLVVLVLSPSEASPDRHFERLASVTHALRLQKTRARLGEADTALACELLSGGLG